MQLKWIKFNFFLLNLIYGTFGLIIVKKPLNIDFESNHIAWTCSHWRSNIDLLQRFICSIEIIYVQEYFSIFLEIAGLTFKINTC